MDKYIVYVHTNIVNGKKYVGITKKSPVQRWGRDGSGYKSNSRFWNAICKYGWNSGFKHEVLFENLSLDEAYSKEQELILLYDSKLNGYNLTDGGDGAWGHTVSEESRIRMSKAQKGIPKPWLQGRTFTDEHRRKLSESHRGRTHSPLSDATKEKISARLTGRRVSDEARKNMSKAFKGRTAWNKGKYGMYTHTVSSEAREAIGRSNGKPVGMFNPETGELVKAFYSTAEATRYIVSTGKYKTKTGYKLCEALRLGIDSAVYGYIWKYIEKEENKD